MEEIRFAWNREKNRSNREKHGVSFEEGKSVFFDEMARIIFDPDHSEEEERFIILGISMELNILVVVHCYRENGSVIRIISARRATKNEAKQYREFLP